MSRKIILFAIVLSVMSGCANFNDKMTPSLSVHQDQFDGSLSIEQPPVSASSSLSEGWHTLGFQWNQNFPNEIFLVVGVSGIENVVGVMFNVDGKVMTNIKDASTLTKYGDWSTRRFVMPISDFVKVAQGSDVKMKVMQIDTYSVSSFGSINSGAIVNAKFAPFIKKLKEQKIFPSVI
ncbi:hypothetical protein C0Z01_06650 [Photobacterium kishitanii]|uniref:hypothetical protein n=1 Tax=Photobacterium kishitanii TaxID=318456 RepID=UPI0007EEF644|nr:hypothetical protein [Photobacterium kishitanii]OBU28751.1 hypothetical protein AYY22_12755 [Photobacterium kishitanii]PSW70234.1 hypothetical protein C0Z01_06650 [Photobacterium kishitanii]